MERKTNHLLQGVLWFFAVVGVGSALTLIIYPPLNVHVVTVEKPVLQVVEKVIERQVPAPAPPPPVVIKKRPQVLAKAHSEPMKTVEDCGNDPLCHIVP